MALKDCKECGKKVSNKAIQCTHCGAPALEIDQVGKVRKLLLKILIPLIAGLIGIFIGIGLFC
jgi:hypothetical protein